MPKPPTVKSLQVELPPELPNDRNARRCVVTWSNGNREIVGNNPADIQRLARALFDVRPEQLPLRWNAGKPKDEGLVAPPPVRPGPKPVPPDQAKALAETSAIPPAVAVDPAVLESEGTPEDPEVERKTVTSTGGLPED